MDLSEGCQPRTKGSCPRRIESARSRAGAGVKGVDGDALHAPPALQDLDLSGEHEPRQGFEVIPIPVGALDTRLAPDQPDEAARCRVEGRLDEARGGEALPWGKLGLE